MINWLAPKDTVILITYRVYKTECRDLKRLQLRNENRYDDVSTLIIGLIANSNSFSDTSCASFPTVVNGQQL
jgi:hypothetical protein